MIRGYFIAEEIEKGIREGLQHLQINLSESKKIAESVLKLSDFFINYSQGATPWNETWVQTAYLAYYLPLNHCRASSVVSEAQQRNFLDGIEHVIDFGAGLASASLALKKQTTINNFQLIEIADQPSHLVQKYFEPSFSWSKKFDQKLLKNKKETLAVFSYSLTELESLPDWATECEALMIIEPSTQQDGRKLLELRKKLLDKGYSIWAPCTHQKECPLLKHSPRDWCHDRIHFSAPDWFKKIEHYLPIKNQTLTFSYLLARKKKAPVMHLARTSGDLMTEKGKDRQMVCQSDEREFLAWMHKNKLRQEIPRGVLIEIPSDAKKVSNEIRIESTITIKN